MRSMVLMRFKRNTITEIKNEKQKSEKKKNNNNIGDDDNRSASKTMKIKDKQETSWHVLSVIRFDLVVLHRRSENKTSLIHQW